MTFEHLCNHIVKESDGIITPAEAEDSASKFDIGDEIRRELVQRHAGITRVALGLDCNNPVAHGDNIRDIGVVSVLREYFKDTLGGVSDAVEKLREKVSTLGLVREKTPLLAILAAIVHHCTARAVELGSVAACGTRWGLRHGSDAVLTVLPNCDNTLPESIFELKVYGKEWGTTYLADRLSST